jgi:OOP family OmpA-OmpF porin
MKKTILALSLVCAAIGAHAGDFYVGADVGRTRISADDVKANGTGAALYAGYQLSPNLALEAGYRNLGSDTVAYGGYKVKVSANALQFSVLGSAQLSTDVSAYARLGLNRLEAKASVGSVSAKDSDTKALFGLGLRYAASQQVGVRLEWQKPSSDTNVLAIGADLRF